MGVAQIDIRAVGLPAKLAETLPDARRRHITPAGLIEKIAGEKVVERAELTASLTLEGMAAEGTAVSLKLRARVSVAAFGLKRERAAKRIQTEDGIGAGDQRHCANGRLGDQIPVDRIAEGFVDAHTVDVNRKTFGRAEQRRGGEPVVVDVELERVARALAGVDAAEIIVEVVGCVRGLLPLHVAPVG